MRNGNLLLLDVAARYANYNSDVTRTIRVGGRFTPRQRRIYDAVLRVLRAVIKATVKCKLLRDWQKDSEIEIWASHENALHQRRILRSGTDNKTDGGRVGSVDLQN